MFLLLIMKKSDNSIERLRSLKENRDDGKVANSLQELTQACNRWF